MEFEQLYELLQDEFSDAILGQDDQSTPTTVLVEPAMVYPVCLWLKENEASYFDMLSCLTALDNGPEINTMEVIYNLYSIPFNHHLMVRAVISRKDPKIDSLVNLWRTADWHEREAFDLFGIEFNNHPDLRRILMPADWEGFPMRKDYIEPETYRGMKTVREEGQA